MIELGTGKYDCAPGVAFERIARAQPDAIALAQGTMEWTYGDVLEASGRYSRLFSSLDIGAPVALIFGHNAQAIIAMMGAARAGVLCIPIDPLAPPLGVEKILSDCAMIVTEEKHHFWAEKVGGSIPILIGSDATVDLAAVSETHSADERASDAPSLVYFTSGTQGVAKGALQTHRQIQRTVWRLTEKHGFTPSDRQALLGSFAFAGSIPVILGGLLTGGTIDIIDLRKKNTFDFATQVRERGITILTMTASLLRALTDALADSPSDWHPRVINLSGEPLSTQDIVKLRSKLNWPSDVVHRLASSEVGIVAEWTVDLDLCDPNGLIPAGYPGDGIDLDFVDEDGAPVPRGHIGELIITGQCLCDGYWQRPELTARSFSNAATPTAPFQRKYKSGDLGLLNPAGLVEFMGRIGNMHKIRGHSVDMGAVETALRKIDGVVNAVAVPRLGANGNEYLACFVQQSRQKSLQAYRVRKALHGTLPDFMMPKRIVVMNDLPLTAGGKINKHKLPEIDRLRPAGMAPVVEPIGSAEIALAKIWAEVLEIDEISRQDDFFELGGDSLDALAVAMALQESQSMEFDEQELFMNSNLIEMAQILETATA